MRQWFLDLPGPVALKVVVSLVIVVVAVVALFFAYDWIGGNLLDTGGRIG